MTNSQNFDFENNEFDDELADNFVVPGATSWIIDGVDVLGQYGAGGPASSFNVRFYTNGSGNLPASVITSRPNQVFTGNSHFQITISPTVTLPSGTYWVSVQANLDFTIQNQYWYWNDRTQQSAGAGAAWKNEGNGWQSGCRSFTRRSTCIPQNPEPDQVYRLRGTSVAQPPPPPPPPPPAGVLYDQYNNAGSLPTNSQDFEPAWDAYDDELADDFVVPAGGWRINGLDVQGQYFNGPGPASSVNVRVYRNGSGSVPGTLVAIRPSVAFTGAPSFSIPLNPPINLSSGTYWVSVQANQNYIPTGEWGWQNRTVTSNASAAWQNPGGGHGRPCRTWARRSTTCNLEPGAPDQVYRIRGTLGAPPPPVPVTCVGIPATIVGTEGNDVRAGTGGDDVIAGLGGNDQIDGGGGDDYICGGSGDDGLVGGDGQDSLFGEAGNDIVDGGPGYLDLVSGGVGNDRLTGNQFAVVSYLAAPGPVRINLLTGRTTGSEGTDTLRGFPYVFGPYNYSGTITGNRSPNIFFGGRQNDVIDGGGGFDVVAFGSDAGVRANLATGATYGGTDEGNDRLVAIEGLYGGAGNDLFVGNAQANFLAANGGDDFVRGSGGIDRIFGDAGNDRLYGQAGNDLLDGGTGTNTLDGGLGENDEVSYEEIPTGVAGQTGVAADLTTGSASAGGNPGIHDSLRGLESVAGSDYPDTLRGNSKGNTLIGNAGADRLLGERGNDFLNGGSDDDTADAGSGGADYCLDTEVTVRCEIRARNSARNASVGALQAPLLDRLVTGVCNAADCPFGEAPFGGLSAQVNPASFTESKGEPTCARASGGGGVTTIRPPAKIRDPDGGNGKVRWRATLHRRGSGPVGKATPLAEGKLVGPAGRPGAPTAWTKPNTKPIEWPTRVRLTRPGVYFWVQTVTLKDLGPGGTGTVAAHYQPAGSASGKPFCDFR